MIDIEKLCEQGIREWQQTQICTSLSSHYVDSEKQKQQETQLDVLLQQLKPYLDSFPKQKYAQRRWRKKGEEWFREWLKQDEVFLLSDMRDEDHDVFMEVTKSFVRDARIFDPLLSIEDIGQAMRNVWIIVILQRIFGKEIGYHKAMFAYSMLYPYSDNYLDDSEITMEEKKQFNQWFTNRLKGCIVPINNAHQEKIAALIGMIEEVFPRGQFPNVYEGLLLIQDAQILSLSQQDGKNACSDDELTYISYRKGGTSVVADGFLIDGEMRSDEILFCMRYGFMLQIGDDLQDAKGDALAHHQTLVSTNLNQPLDTILCKLIQYTKDILAPSSVCKDKVLLDFVINDCLMLLFLAVMDTKQYYTSTLYQKVVQCLPISIAYIERMKSQAQWNYQEDELWKWIDCLVFDNEKTTDKIC